jgi:transposase-like protein
MPCCYPCSTSFGRIFMSVVAASAIAIIATGFVRAEDKPAPKPVKSQPYPLATCIVSGEKLGSMGKPVVKTYDNRDVRFCCKDCVSTFEAEQAAYMKKIDDQIIEQQLKHYPLTTCVVMEEDELSDPSMNVNYVYANRLVRFCCPDCVKPFNADPAKYLAMVDAAVIEQQKDAYPLKTCPVSGEELGGVGEPVTKVYGVTMVKFCCNGCVNKFEADYSASMAKVTDAWKARHGDDKAPAKPDDHAGHDHSGHDH